MLDRVGHLKLTHMGKNVGYQTTNKIIKVATYEIADISGNL
jgi:hypothetical protein